MAILATVFVIMLALFSGGLCRTVQNQHAPLSIKTKVGQVYNCVEFHKQHAFSHSSFKNKVIPNFTEIQAQQKHSKFGLEGDGCPIGTVPILIQPPPTPPLPTPKKHCRAVVQTRADDPNKKFFGIGGTLSLYKPDVQSAQWSSARMKLINGGESIEAGWMVNPAVFKDNEAHLFARFIGGGKECINTQCQGGFVQVDTRAPLGLIPEYYSTIGGVPEMWKLSIEKDEKTGHWWLSMYSSEDEKVSVGYWPKTLFTSLVEFGSQIEWGGEVDNPGQTDPPPSMGNGRQATYDTELSAFFANSTYIGRGGTIYNNPDNTEKAADCNTGFIYRVLDHGYNGVAWGLLIYYGGPGPEA